MRGHSLSACITAESTGAAHTDSLSRRAKLFRYDKDTNQWKERGTGDIKFLKHKDSKKIRVLMRREKTHKICANHYLVPSLKLAPNVGSDRSWVWTATDFSEEAPTVELLAIRFASPESTLVSMWNVPLAHANVPFADAKEFKEKFEQCQKEMAQHAPSSPQKPVEKSDASAAHGHSHEGHGHSHEGHGHAHDAPATTAPAAEKK